MERLQDAAPSAHFVKAFSCVGNGFMIDPKLPGGPPTMLSVVRVVHGTFRLSWTLPAGGCTTIAVNRNKDGALWVLGVEQPNHVAVQLEAWGFKPRAPRGWFKE